MERSRWVWEMVGCANFLNCLRGSRRGGVRDGVQVTRCDHWEKKHCRNEENHLPLTHLEVIPMVPHQSHLDPGRLSYSDAWEPTEACWGPFHVESYLHCGLPLQAVFSYLRFKRECISWSGLLRGNLLPVLGLFYHPSISVITTWGENFAFTI